MANELRKTLGRNMRYAQENERIDNQIRQLQTIVPYNKSIQIYIDALEKQREENVKHMQQPISRQEAELYDDYGQYTGTDATEQNNGFGQMVIDGITHAAQGMTLGWSDETFGAIVGAGQVIGNGLWRATGHSVNGETLADAWNKGYQEYRDFARQELQNAYERNPAVSAGSEIIGSALSPVKPFRTRGYTGATLGKFIAHPEDIARARWLNAVATGVANGTGYTNQNTLGEYGKNIVNSIITNVGGTALGNKVFGRYNDMYRFGRGTMNAGTQIIAPTLKAKEDIYE